MSCKADSDDILLFAILNSLTKPITVQLSYSHIVWWNWNCQPDVQRSNGRIFSAKTLIANCW